LLDSFLALEFGGLVDHWHRGDSRLILWTLLGTVLIIVAVYLLGKLFDRKEQPPEHGVV
jgi:hypothetical protein